MRVRIAREAEIFLLMTDPPSRSLVGPFTLLHMPDLPVPQVQAWRVVSFSESGTILEHMVLMAQDLPGKTARRDLAARVMTICPGAVGSLIVTDGTGSAEVESESEFEAVAAVVSEIKRRGGWDESPVFRISFGSVAFDVRVDWHDDHADAAVVRVG